MLTILVVDDEKQIRRALRNELAGDDARILEASTGEEALSAAASERPDAIILDLGLPDISGAEVCREIRKWSRVPIIILSARHSDIEKAALLDAGADDYVTKPFSTLELSARVRAHLRRAREAIAPDSPILDLGRVRIDVAKPAATVSGQTIHLTRTEWDLLRALLANRGRTTTHRQLYARVWGNSFGDAQENLRVHIRSLRRKLEEDPVRPRFIVTEPGVGYRFEIPENTDDEQRAN
jgi:two-component system KDP operon response regulator KdpE